MTDYTSQIVGNLDTDGFQEFVDGLDDTYSSALGLGDVKQALLSAATGTPSEFFNTFVKLLREEIAKYFAGFLPAFITVIAICLLKNMLGGMTSNFLDNSTTEVVHVVCYSVIIVLVMSAVTSVISTVVGTIENLGKFAAAVFPLLLTLLAALGGNVGAATYQPLMASASAVVLAIIREVVVPAFIACIVFSVVGNLSKNVKLTKLTKLFRSGASWLIGILFAVFGIFLTVGGVSGASLDRVGYNAAKFAVSSYVPILGGYLSDGFDLVTASLTLVKNAVGYTGVLVLLAVVIFPILKLVAFLLSLRLTAAVVEPIGDERVSNMLTAVADNTTLLIAALAGTAFIFFVIVMMIMSTFNFAG